MVYCTGLTVIHYREFTCIMFISSSYTDKPESSDMEALTLAIKSCNVVMVGMSDEFCDSPECKKLLLYVKDVLHKPVLLVLLGQTKRWQKGDLSLTFGTEVFWVFCTLNLYIWVFAKQSDSSFHHSSLYTLSKSTKDTVFFSSFILP